MLFTIHPFLDENALKFSNSYYQKLVQDGFLHTINGNKRFFNPSCAEINNAFVGLSHVRNEVSDVVFSIDKDDDYLTERI